MLMQDTVCLHTTCWKELLDLLGAVCQVVWFVCITPADIFIMVSLETLVDGVALVAASWSDLSTMGDDAIDVEIAALGLRTCFV